MKRIVLLLSFVLSFSAFAQTLPDPVEPGMTNEKLDELIKRFDKNVVAKLGYWQLKHEGVMVYIVTDAGADRMRIIVPIAEAASLEKEHFQRLMQANFDTALDARYAIAQGNLWSAFIHPLGALTEKSFFSGLAQTITLARTFGTSFSSGALSYSGGDSKAEQEKIYQELLKKGLSV